MEKRQSILHLAIGVLMASMVALAQSSMPPASRGPDPAPPAASLPSGAGQHWWSQAQTKIQEDEYTFTRHEPANLAVEKILYQAPNRAQGFRTLLSENGIRLVPRTDGGPRWEWGLALAGEEAGSWKLEAGNKQKPEIQVSDNRIEFDRGWITEWYVNSPEGLEQGFTIPCPLPEAGTWKPEAGSSGDSNLRTPDSDLHLDLRLTGNLRPVFSDDGQAVDFYGNGNIGVLRYGQLKITDAAGKILPARFEEIIGGIRIALDGSGALYPVTIDPLIMAPAWIGEGNQLVAHFGYSVASAGDVNGDGYGDVIVGAMQYDSGQTNEGAAFLYLGSASGLGSSAQLLQADQANAEFGTAVSTVGDINGDGYSDVAVGAYYWDGVHVNDGAVFVYLGSASGLVTPPAYRLDAGYTDGGFGGGVDAAGDLNGDGYGDLVASAIKATNPDHFEGAVAVYYGAAGGLNLTPLILEGNQADALYGLSVGTAGDVNGDGFSDLYVGSYRHDNGEIDEGAAFIYYGSGSGLVTTPTMLEVNQPGALLGTSGGTAGDVNGDGYSDVIVGSVLWTNGETYEGAAFVFHGSPSGIETLPAWLVEGNQANIYFGESSGTAGDVNGDGYADVVIGADYYTNGEALEGAIFVYYGSSTGLGSIPTICESNIADARLGQTSAPAGDVNGDGFSDVIAGAPYADCGLDQEGAAYLFLGSAAGPSESAGWSMTGNQVMASAGYSVAGAGDVNGDGYADVLVGIPEMDIGEADRGKVNLYLGSSTGLPVTASWSVEGDQAGAMMGTSLGSAGDVNGDGYADVIIGAPFYDGDFVNEGKAVVYLGSVSGLAASPAWTTESGQAGARHGWSVGAAGDVNGDGYGDVIVSAVYFDNDQANEGRVYVYLGSPAGPSLAPSWVVESDQANSTFGSSVGTAGDVNRDGYSDVIVGAMDYDNGVTDEGAAFVYHGSATGLSLTTNWSVYGNQATTWFGQSVATAGDVNGDGYSDVIIGAPVYDNGEENEGRAFLYLGGPSGLESTPVWTVESNMMHGNSGYSVASAGDVNGDGYSDVVVGVYGYTNGETFEGGASLYLGGAGSPMTPAWTQEINQESACFGASVASAGDVNGDGYSDVIVGAYNYDDGETDEGAAFLYYGNGGPGAPLRLRQMRSDLSAPVAPLGRAGDGLFKISVTGRTPFGRGDVKLEWQMAPLGGTFSPSLNPIQAEMFWSDSGLTGAYLSRFMVLPDLEGPYIWRARTRYGIASSPYQSHGPWLTLAANGMTETDIRSAPACVLPDERVWIYEVVKSDPEEYPILSFQDPNQSNQRTGWNIRRSSDPGLPKETWPIIGSNIVDMDAGAPNYQYTDFTGATGTWYYQVTAYNSYCPVEGPF